MHTSENSLVSYKMSGWRKQHRFLDAILTQHVTFEVMFASSQENSLAEPRFFPVDGLQIRYHGITLYQFFQEIHCLFTAIPLPEIIANVLVPIQLLFNCQKIRKFCGELHFLKDILKFYVVTPLVFNFFIFGQIFQNVS